MRLGIEVSNIRAGGGITHLVEFLRAATPQEQGFEQVIIWGGSSALNRVEGRPWLRKVHEPLLDRPLPFRIYWQQFLLDNLVYGADCDLLFVPGGNYTGSFRPFVAMSQNLLPFEMEEAKRYGVSWDLLRLMMLRRVQSRTFRTANGVIFLTEYARDNVLEIIKELNGFDIVIPHGVSERFMRQPRVQNAINTYSFRKPFHILYVSTVNLYKHQWHVAEAVSQLRQAGFPIQLDLIGSASPVALDRLQQTIERLDPAGTFLRYHGKVSHTSIVCEYQNADLFVFASSCETFGQVLTEAMAAGLPIACSCCEPMPEILGDAGVYFDPEESSDIAASIRKLLEDPELRAQKAWNAHERAKQFSWKRCARETFDFIARIVNKNAR